MSTIISDFLIVRPEGFYCPYGDFYLDPLKPVPKAVISHAHGDHAVPGHGRIYCTTPTRYFMKYRFKHAVDTFTEIDYQQTFKIGDVAIQFVPAGHMLGSAQVLMLFRGVRYLYTGDYKLQSDPTCEPLEPVRADVLITESTFADPEVKHPDPVAEIKKLNDISFNIMLGAYALGKAQRLTQLIHQHCPDKAVRVHHGIMPYHQLYEVLGAPLGVYKPYSRKEMKSGNQNLIYLVPPFTFHSYIRAVGVVRMFASGWKHLHQRNDEDLYISDHVDWQDIIHYIAEVQPREIWTVHGDGHHLKHYYAGEIPIKVLN